MSGKYALIIGNTEYLDPGLAQLTAPGRDTEDFARVLKDQEIGSFDSVNILLNQPSSSVIEAIDEFFDQKKPDDLLVLYFSGHGVRDELGALYLAVQNTNRFRLRSTAIKSDFVREAMDQSRSKRQVLILDCCNSGAFSQGTKAATGVSIGTASAFEAGYGRIILTASDSTQFAWEGDQVIGETDNSLFTHFLVKGLEGEADLDGDGRITVDELYDYAYEQVKLVTPKQTPSKFSSKQQGEIILRQNIRIEDTRLIPLPDDLTAAMNSSLPYVREGAVRQLEGLLNGRNLNLARSARLALEKIAEEDDSRRVSQLATQVLEPIRQAEQLAIQKAKEQRLAAEKAEAEQKAKEAAGRPKAEMQAAEGTKARREPAKQIGIKENKLSKWSLIPIAIPGIRSSTRSVTTKDKFRLISFLAILMIGYLLYLIFYPKISSSPEFPIQLSVNRGTVTLYRDAELKAPDRFFTPDETVYFLCKQDQSSDSYLIASSPNDCREKKTLGWVRARVVKKLFVQDFPYVQP